MIGMPNKADLIHWKNAEEASHTTVARTITEDFLDWQRKRDASQNKTARSVMRHALDAGETDLQRRTDEIGGAFRQAECEPHTQGCLVDAKHKEIDLPRLVESFTRAFEAATELLRSAEKQMQSLEQ